MAKRPVSTYDFLNYRTVTDPQVSPDGTQVLYVCKGVGPQNSYDTSIWLASLTDGAIRPFTTGYDDKHPRWSPDGQRIAFLRGDGQGHAQLYIMSRNGGEATPLAFFPEGTMGEFQWSPNGQWIALTFRETAEDQTSQARYQRQQLGLSDSPVITESLWYRYDGQGSFGSQRFALYLVDARQGSASQIFSEDHLGHFSFSFSPDSQKLAVTANTEPEAILYPWKDELYILDIASRTTQPVKGVPACKKYRVRWSPGGDKIAFGGFLGQERGYCPDNVQLFVHDLTSGQTRCATTEHDLCFQGHLLADGTEAGLDPNYIWDVEGTRLLASVSLNGQRHIVSIDAQTGAATFLTFDAVHCELGNISKDGSIITFTRGSVTSLPEVYVGLNDGQKMEIKQLTHMNEYLEDLEIVTPEVHWVDSSDGVKVQTWVFKPSADMDTGAAILDIHGGPHSMYGEGYRHDVQVLVALGFTVVYSNPRGSKGYGRSFSNALKAKWGDKDWDDIQAVISFMKMLPGIDLKRMGVLGVSYGGYMVNWVTSHTDIFKAAVSDRGISNLISDFGTSDVAWIPESRWIGSPWNKSELLWDQSPLKYVGNVKTPTLILHGEGDLRVSITQSEEWFSSLKQLGVPARFVRYPRKATHQFARIGPPDLRLHRLEQIVMWFGTYLLD
jgi:dipeptidyl aminopeptidase/acylaminoacyl peptidase